MNSLREQILTLFKDVDPELQRVVVAVLAIEQEFIHMKNPNGIMEKIDDVLDRIAKELVEREESHEN